MKAKTYRTIICCFILLLSACISGGLTTEAPGTPSQPDDILTTNTPDAQIPITAATLYSTDFENGYPPALYDWSQKWHVVMASDSNMIFCNEISDQWSSVLFGKDDWKNYTLSLKMKFISDNEDQTAETFIRITEDFEGYRANLSNFEWADIFFYPPYSSLDSSSVSINQTEWFQVQMEFTGEDLAYSINGELVLEGSDDTRRAGRAGFGAGPNTEVCVDDIQVWMIDRDGNPIESPPYLVIEPDAGIVYSINEKIEDRATIPVFYPWAGNCGQTLWFDCDTNETPYGLVWIAAGNTEEIDSTEPTVSPAQEVFMRSDGDTLYLISEEWHYWNLGWQFLSPESIFYLDEIYTYHVDSEYGTNMMINFEHPEWPGVMAEKALNYKEAGFDGMMLDWWHNNAGNGRSRSDVESARMAIAKAIRRKVGDDFILLGNVNYGVNDPTAMYLSGVFLELWKSSSSDYSLASIERMEDLLIYWDTNLRPPKIIAFEPWKITTGDYIEDRFTEENMQYAKLFAAMAVVIPENGYILYADNNDDWDGGDHQHAYYDFYHTDFGKPITGMATAMEGVAYKLFERGLIAYNRTAFTKQIRLPGGRQIRIGPLDGVFIEGDFRIGPLESLFREGDDYIFFYKRTSFRLDLSENGTLVINRRTGDKVTVPYGAKMVFDTYSRYSKDTSSIIHNVRSHAETYAPWDDTVDLPVDYLRTGASSTWDGMTPQESIEAIETCPRFFPDRADKVVVAYVNLMEFTRVGNWDFAFDPSWDTNNDNLIDDGVTDLPDYVDTKVFNEAWANYVAAYWTDSWKMVLQKRIDLAAAENFDGVMFDVLTGYWTWMNAYPESNLEDYRQRSATLIKEMSEYAKSKYGTAFLITANLDSNVYLYFEDLGAYVDGGYFQNAYFAWDGSGYINEYGISGLDEGSGNPLIEFMGDQGLSLLNMDHLGTGEVSPGLDFENYDDRITEENLLLLFRWAAESGSLPFVTEVFMHLTSYNEIPRFSRVIPGKEAFGNTAYNDWVLGSNADDVVLTGDGSDLFYGGQGNDRFEGGPGSDAALFNGNMNEYTISHDVNDVTTIIDNAGQDGVDTLIDVELLIFNDTTVPN